MRAAGLEPLCAYPGTKAKWPSRCTVCKAEVAPRYEHVKAGRSRGNCDCTKAARRAIRTDPVQAVQIMRDAGLEPLVEFPGVRPKWECLCTECEEIVEPRFEHVRDGRSSGCKFCAGTAVTERQAVAVMLAANLEPPGPYPGSNRAPWQVRCLTCKWTGGAIYEQARVHSNGCRRCGGHVFDPDEMTQMMREAGFEPLIPYPGVDVSWPCLCMTCGHRVIKLAQHVRAGSGCMRCAGKILPAEEAAERMIAAGFIPQEPYPGQNSARWLCECVGCKAMVRTTYKGIMSGRGAGCCNGLMDFRRPGRSMGLYLMVHPGMNAAKIGVGVATHGRMPRVARHLGRGWLITRVWTEIPEPGIAFDIEKQVISEWRAAGLPAFLERKQMPHSGHTETVQLDRIDLEQVIALVEDELTRAGVEAPVPV